MVGALNSVRKAIQHEPNAPDSELVERLYRSVVDNVALQEFLDGCSAALRSTLVTLLHHNFRHPERSVLNFNSANEADDFHYRKFTANGDFVDRTLPYIHPGTVVRLPIVMRESLFRKTQFYDYFCLQNDFKNGMAVTIHADDEQLVALVFNRPDNQPFTDEDQRWLEQLAPHLLTYHRLAGHVQQLNLRLRKAHKALDTLNFGVAMLAPGNQVRFMNKRAKALVEHSDFLSLDNEQLRSKRADVDAWLSSRVRAASRCQESFKEADFSMMLQEGSERLHLFILPLKSQEAGCLKNCLLLISDMQINAAKLSSCLAAMYGLSTRESQVAAFLTQGFTAAQIADRMKVKDSTIRTLIKRVFTKTDVSRQVDLIRIGLSMNMH